MVGVRVRHRRVLAQHVHTSDASLARRIHDLHHGEARLRVELLPPVLLEARVGFRVIHALVVREHHRNEPRVGGALHVVLAAQRMQPRSGLADLAGHQGERDEAARVVGAVHVLRDAHAPQDHRTFRRGIGTRHLADRFRRDAAVGRHRLRAEALRVLLEGFESGGALADELRVHEVLLEDRVDHRVEERHVHVRRELQHAPGVPGDVGAPRVGDHQLRAALHRVLDPGRRHRVIRGGIGADEEDELRPFNIPHRVRYRAGADALQQRRHRGGVAQARAVIHVVGAESRAHQLLEEVGLFIGALGAAETRQRVAAVRVAHLPQPAGG